MKKILFVIFLLILGMGSCTVYELYKATHPYTEKEEQEMREKASKAAVEYFKTKKNWDITVIKVEFSTDITSNSINVYGYVTGDEKKEVYASVDYRNDYEVKYASD